MEKPSALHEDIDPDLVPSLRGSYTCSVPVESQHARLVRLQQRNLKKRSAEDCAYAEDEKTGVRCQIKTGNCQLFARQISNSQVCKESS